MARSSKVTDNTIQHRQMMVIPATLDKEKRTVDCVAATEEPVLMMDHQRKEVVPETLLMSGVIMPGSRSVPMLDTHLRETLQNIVGSVTGISIENGRAIGTASFADTDAGEQAWRLYRDGHATDFSVGYRTKKRIYLRPGEKRRIEGRDFEGPMNVATSWEMKEISGLPLGADPNAKVRSDDESLNERNDSMNAILRKFLATRGLPKDANDEQAAEWLNGRGMPKDTADIPAWVDANDDKIPVPQTPAQRSEGTSAGTGFTGQSTAAQTPLETRSAGATQSFDPKASADAFFKELREKEKTERDSRRKLETMVKDQCRKHGIDDLAVGIIDTAMDEQAAQRAILDALATRQTDHGVLSPMVSYGPSQEDKSRRLVETAMTMRMFDGARVNAAMQEEMLPSSEREKGWEQYRNHGPLGMVAVYLEMNGLRPGLRNRVQMAKFAVSSGQRAYEALGLSRSDIAALEERQAVHNTGSFPALMANVMNKTLAAKYKQAPQFWRRCFRQGASVPDFKRSTYAKFSGGADLEAWPENMPIPEGTFADEKETYGVTAYARKVSLGWQLYVNDDLDALNRIPIAQAEAADRTVDKAAFAVLTSAAGLGPTMADGQTLFLETPTGNRKRSNYTVGAATPTVATLQTMTGKMALMRGLNQKDGSEGDDLLALMPDKIIAPVALATTVFQLVNSTADPAASQAGVANPARGAYETVIVPHLDASSLTAFYMLSSQWDSVVVTFLQGQETPVFDSWVEHEDWSRHSSVVQSFTAWAADHRAIQKHKGAA